MKRASAYIFAVAVATVLIVMAAAAWVLGTTEGAGWLLTSVSRHTDAKISFGRIEGRLLDHLRLEQVLLVLPQKEAQLDSLDIRWQPLFLFGGILSVKELVARNVRIQDNAPVTAKKEPVLAWPRVPAIAELLEGSIGRLEVHGLTYRRLDQEPVRITTLFTSVTWRETLLSVTDLAAVSSSGRVAGNLSAGFARPSLQADLAVTPPHPIAEMNLLFLHARLLPGRGKEQVAGSVTISGRSGARQRLEVTGEVGMTRNAFNLRKLHLIAPGRRGTVTGEGSIVLTAQEPLLALQMKVANLDLAPELKRPTAISGSISFNGTPERYRGRFTLANSGKGWQTMTAAAEYQGTRSGMTLAPLTCSLLDGTVQGNVAVGWTEGVSVKGALRGSNLDPARVAADWSGIVNFDLEGSAAWSNEVPLRGEVNGKLLDSRLHGQPLKGEVRASFARENVVIDRLALQGKGFDLHAAGQLDKRLDVSAHVSDLSRLVPETSGEITADGWLRWRGRRAAGAFTADGRNLAVNGMELSGMKLTAKLEEGEGYPVHAAATFSDVSYDSFQVDSATILADGTTLDHTINLALRSTGAEARMELSGGYGDGTWRGKLLRLSGRDSIGPWMLQAPAAVFFSPEKMSVAPLVITGLPQERLELDGELSREPLQGSLRAEWHGLNAARANHWVQEAQFQGSSTGNVRMHLASGALTVAGTVTATGTITTDEHRVTIQRSSLSIDGGERGIRASVELRQADGGTLRGTLSSSTPARLALPEEGNVGLELAGIDLQLIRPWLPEDFNVQGTLAGRATGKFLPGQRLELNGNAAVSRGRVHVQKPAGEINADLRTASASWNWRGETLRGTFAFALTEEGEARGTFELPLPARLPIALDPKGPVQGSLTGHVQEKGILTTMFPGLVQESHGELDADVRVTGRWEDPRIGGVLQLAKAGAYLPTAGIRVENVRLTARLDRDLIRIDPFEAASGPGRITGTALIQLKGWQVAGYRGTINGEKFRTVYFPEIQLLSSPHLTFEGTPEKLVVRGEIRLPELLIYGPPTHNKSIEPSKDVVVEGMPPPAEKKAFPLALDIEVRVALGDRVLVKAEGIDAELGGAMDLSVLSLDKIISKGEIKVVKGNYKTYGVNLQIVRGRVFYAGGPIRQPTLDILALRTVGEIRAGVTIAGTPQAPIIKLYSEPGMPDVDILAYVVLGHPLGSSSGDQGGLMAGAAAALLSAGQSVVLQDEIKNRLGLSTLELETTTGETAGRMGYKEVQVTPPGKAPAKQAGVSQTMLTVGKYLTPELYVSYGRSLFTEGNLFRLRYDLSKRWQVQSETGSESGVDLYYKIDFK